MRPVLPYRARAAESAAQLLATVQRLYRELQLASPMTRPVLVQEIRATADRYRACTQEELSPCSS